jgi:hypothetical protein
MCRSIFSIAVLVAVSATPLIAKDAGEQPLSRKVDALLRREATAKTTDERRAAVRQLVEFARDMESATGVAPAERSRAKHRVRARLAQLHRELERPAAAGGVRRDRPPLLAQVGPGAGGGPGNPPAPPNPPDHGEDLAELIRQTIAPETWDVNGGNGVIVYFPARRVLVVRQQSEVHWGLADVLDQLHGN